MMFAARERFGRNGVHASLPVRIGAAMLIVALAAGCHGQLAQKNDFFAPGGAAGARRHTETQRVLAFYQALQAAQRVCPGGEYMAATRDPVSSEATAAGERPGPERPWVRPCPDAGGSHAAYGGASNSYRRWVEDQVRPLPAPSETASSIGSGS